MNTYRLPPRWTPVVREDVGRLEDELARETCERHPLHGARVKALFRRYPHDDVLFEVQGRDHPFYCVHLTWSIETDPRWPFICRFSSLADFADHYEEMLDVDEDDPRWPKEGWRFFNE